MRRIPIVAAAGLLALALLATGWPGSLSAQDGKALTVPFKVFAADSATPTYLGTYEFTPAGSLLTEKWRYRKTTGEPIIERDSVFDLAKRRPVSFFDRNFLTGRVFKTKVDGDKITVRIEDLKGNVDTDKTVSLPKETFIWPNFFNVLPQDWDKLNKGSGTYEARIFAQGRQDDYGMQVKSEGDVTVSGIAGKRFRVESSSAFGRALAPAIHMTFAIDAPHRVIRYEGNEDIPGPDGKPSPVTILYEWPKG